MIEIWPNLFIGNETDYETKVKQESGWRVIHACKDPYHRQELGYTGRSIGKDHPEYLIARRGDRLILNLIDAPTAHMIPKIIIDTAIKFIHESLIAGHKVLVHCNLGESRAPAIGLLYLATYTAGFKNLETAEAELVKIYPPYKPGGGIAGFVNFYFDSYVTNGISAGD